MYIDLKSLVRRIKNRGVTIQIENRIGWFDYGFPKQHAEILNYYNAADDCCWDALILGYKNPDMKYEEKYKTKHLIGIILIENGNHKLLFRLPYKRGFDENIFRRDVKKFTRNYSKKWGLKTSFIKK
jgi:hypothetical protein